MSELMISMSHQVPSATLVEGALPEVHYADSFALDVPRGTFGTVDDLARACAGYPRWGMRLMRLRDRLVRPFGLKTVPIEHWRALDASSAGPPLTSGSTVGIFRILSRAQHELLMGEDDHHLDFRLSFWLDLREPERERAVVTTTVRFRNAFGRFYFALVRPFHALIVRGMLRDAARALWSAR